MCRKKHVLKKNTEEHLKFFVTALSWLSLFPSLASVSYLSNRGLGHAREGPFLLGTFPLSSYAILERLAGVLWWEASM